MSIYVGGAPGKVDLYVGKEMVKKGIPNDLVSRGRGGSRSHASVPKCRRGVSAEVETKELRLTRGKSSEEWAGPPNIATVSAPQLSTQPSLP